jgi:hypothetical protein
MKNMPRIVFAVEGELEVLRKIFFATKPLGRKFHKESVKILGEAFLHLLVLSECSCFFSQEGAKRGSCTKRKLK